MRWSREGERLFERLRHDVCKERDVVYDLYVHVSLCACWCLCFPQREMQSAIVLSAGHRLTKIK